MPQRDVGGRDRRAMVRASPNRVHVVTRSRTRVGGDREESSRGLNPEDPPFVPKGERGALKDEQGPSFTSGAPWMGRGRPEGYPQPEAKMPQSDLDVDDDDIPDLESSV